MLTSRWIDAILSATAVSLRVFASHHRMTRNAERCRTQIVSTLRAVPDTFGGTSARSLLFERSG